MTNPFYRVQRSHPNKVDVTLSGLGCLVFLAVMGALGGLFVAVVIWVVRLLT